MSKTETETSARSALNVLPLGATATIGGLNAFQSPSGEIMQSTSATIVALPVASTTKISSSAVLYAKTRRLSQKTLEALNVASGITYFPKLEAKSEALFFKYPEGWKAKAYPQKAFVAGGGWKLAFWNIERVLQVSPDIVYICEGEIDACALVEAGISPDQVLSVPNGARQRPTDDPKALRGYGYVDEALAAGLNKINKFVWCGDSDDAGYALRADMVKLIGSARFWMVDWPEGTKDANDYLCSDGPQSLRELVTEGCRPYPAQGLYSLLELPEPAPLALWRPGFPEWENKVLLAPRTLSVVTGQPGMGKTLIFQQIWFQVIKEYGVVACMASFETRAKPHIRRQLRTLLLGKLERTMTEEEMAKADAWINDRYLFLVHPEQRPTLEWLLDMAEIAVVRHGARIIQIDPWNRVEASRTKEETETEYIGRCLRGLHTFAHDMNCHVQILAHPAKMDSRRRGEPPDLEDINGSKNWQNMVDQGFVVHRPEMFDPGTGQRRTDAILYHRKTRFDELGYPCKLNLDYKLDQGRYVSTDYVQGYGSF